MNRDKIKKKIEEFKKAEVMGTIFVIPDDED